MWNAWGRREMHIVYWWGSLVERDSLEDLTLLRVHLVYHNPSVTVRQHNI
jgi:hypothetical protein